MVEIANVDAAAAWDGHEGDSWTEQAGHYDRSSRFYRRHLISPEIIGTGDRIIDIGCGAGRPTLEAAAIAVDGAALGVDLSRRMLQLARERAEAEGIGNATFLHADAQVHPFEPGAADLVMSNCGVMFFEDRVAAFANIGNGLRSGGRLAVLTWRELDQNEWLVELRGALALGRDLPVPPPDAPTPFSMADPDRVRSTLTEAGFRDIELEPIDEPIEMGTDPDDAFTWVCTLGMVEGLLQDVDDAGRAHAMDNLRALLEARATPEGVLLNTSAWLITAVR
jgi:SAM-dependent methyltransferase